MERWVLAVVWATLPVTAGGAIADATAGWSDAPQVVAAALCWVTWAAALLAIVVPRTIGLTVVRAAAPDFALLAVVIAAVADVGTATALVAVAATLVAAVLATRPALAIACANAAAYGDERRVPLRVPPGLFLAPLPAARVLLGAAIAAGPLLLADERWAAGAVAVVAGVPIAALAARALHGLSTRWAVLVPAGFVVVDPLTLADPVLFPRERIVSLGTGGQAPPTGDAVLDLRLGASLGTLVLVLDRPADLSRSRRARRGADAVKADTLCIAVVEATRFLEIAVERRIPVVARG